MCEAAAEKGRHDDRQAGHAAVGFICPPTTPWKRRLLTFHSWLRLCIADYLWPVDGGADMNVCCPNIFREHSASYLLTWNSEYRS